MTPKTKRRLKWRATTLESGKYWASRQIGKSLWSSGCDTQILSVDVLRRIAFEACEKHARENPSKK